MGRKTRSYTSEFKNEAAKLALGTVSIGEAAKDLGIPISTLILKKATTYFAREIA